MLDSCVIEHDWFTASLTFGLCCGLVISYLPQHLRIINAGSSEGFSPLFLLLGSTSAAAGMFNLFTMQSGIIKCCRTVGFGTCVEITAGIVQLSLQWILFSLIFVLYMVYYPAHLKYTTIELDTHDSRPPLLVKSPVRSREWQFSIFFAWITIVHLAVITFVTFFILFTVVPSPVHGEPLPSAVYSWARFLGISSAVLASVQYAPQLIHTYRTKLVGALSIPMMIIQTPGAILMVTSIALRPGTNWTSWITFAVAGILQGSLLTMCILWKFRQRKLGVDDFGVPIDSSRVIQSEEIMQAYEDDIPGLIVTAPSNSSATPAGTVVSEETPLLRTASSNGSSKGGWPRWLRR